ncbi:MAG: type 4a pilus biogenesis protein PilO [Pseudomonadota bacterium]
MTKLLEQFGKAPIVVKLVVLAIILAAVAAVEFWMFFTPKKEELDRLRKQSSELKVRLLENQAIADNLPKFQEEVNILNEQLKQALALLPNEADVHTLYRQLSIVAKKTNIGLLSFKPAGQSNKGFYSDLGMDLKIDGTYHDIASFIDQVGKLSRIVNISNLVFSSPKAVGNTIVLNVDCRATTFMFSGGGGR